VTDGTATVHGEENKTQNPFRTGANPGGVNTTGAIAGRAGSPSGVNTTGAIAGHAGTLGGVNTTGSNSGHAGSPGGVLAPSKPRRRLGYRLYQEQGTVWLTRVLVAPDGTETPLRAQLSSPASRALVMEIAPRESDLHLDRLMGSAAGKYRVGTTLPAVMTVLEGAPDVRVGSRSVRVSKEPVMPRVTLREAGSEFELRFERDARIDEILGAGLVLVGDELRPLGETERTGLRLERLPLVRRFSQTQSGELVNNVLPALEKSLVVEIRTDRLPGRIRTLLPRVEFELVSEGEILVARAAIVYGSPVVGRIVQGRLVQSGDRAPKRNLDAEKKLELALRDELDLLLDRPLRLEGLDAARFVERLERFRRTHGGAAHDEKSTQTVELAAELAQRNGGWDLVFHAPSEPDIAVSADVVWRAHLEGIDKLPLSDGRWGLLPKAWLARNAELLEDYLAARSSVDGQRAAQTLLGTSVDDGVLKRPEGFEDYVERMREQSMPELPGDLAQKLRPYQSEGVRWLAALSAAGIGGILADDMGLGKTLQTLAALTGKSLIVVPKSVLHNWRDEIGRFRPDLRVSMYHGPNRSLDRAADVTLTSYAVMRLDQELLAHVEWDWVVLDEAQTIKNAGSQVTEAAFALRGRMRLALTGTPIENRLEELWSEMQFVNPGVLGSLASFRRRFVEPIQAGDVSVSERLRRRVRPFVLRRLKADVAPDLPARTEDVLWVELDENERRIYDAILSESRQSILPGLGSNGGVFEALEALLRLRQAACHPGLLPGRTDTTSSKLDVLLESLDEITSEGQKAIVFSQWTSMLDKVEPELKSRGHQWVRLDGSTTDRAGVVRQFQEAAGPPLLLASLKAGGTGLNLTAADHVYLLDPWWNPAAEAQAADRAHRIGRERPVFIHRLITRETVEQRVLDLQERKRALGSFVDGADPASGLAREEIAELLQ
ncbi:MAG TPA: DEAD/DEAH box helicase, partial [Polyangiaceae bacterium]|nr:DEAD/DEAH box helicase [Polyangiaceae bacterium]